MHCTFGVSLPSVSSGVATPHLVLASLDYARDGRDGRLVLDAGYSPSDTHASMTGFRSAVTSSITNPVLGGVR